MENKQYIKMTTEPIGKLLVSLSIPTIISMMVTTIYNIADTAFVGTLGTSQSGATGVISGFMTILQAIAFMCGQGSGIIMSRKLGEQDKETATKFSSTGFFLSFSLGLIIAVLSFIFMTPLLKVLGSTETIAPFARTYLTFILLSAPFFTSSLTLNNLLRYEGKARFGTIGLMTGSVLNIVGDALLMFGFGMGIEGAGISTALTQFISFCILISMFLRGRTETKISVKYIAKDLATFSDIVATGFPSLVRQALNSIATMMLNGAAAVYGDYAVSAMSIVSRVSFFPTAVAVGVGQGFQPISGFNYGAGKKERVKEAFKKALVMSTIALTVISIPIIIFSPTLVQWLRNDADVITTGTRALRLVSVAQIAIPLTMMVEMGFQGIGEKFLASFSSSLRSGLIFIPTLIIMSRIRGLAGIQEAQPVAFIITFVICLYTYRVYMKKLSS